MQPERLRVRDDVLQVLFWIRGEGLGDEADIAQLAVWLGSAGTEDLAEVVDELHRDGYVVPGRSRGSWSLSDTGLAEGGRRFTEEFADAGLGRAGHGECGPECDCSLHGPEACSEHGRHAHR